MYENLKERLTDMSVLASTRTPADALKYIEELEVKLSESEALLAKAVEALEKLSTAQLFGCGEAWGLRLGESAIGREILARMEYAKATLAELTSSEAANGEAKGGKDE